MSFMHCAQRIGQHFAGALPIQLALVAQASRAAQRVVPLGIADKLLYGRNIS